MHTTIIFLITVVLGVLTGISGMHYHQVRGMVGNEVRSKVVEDKRSVSVVEHGAVPASRGGDGEEVANTADKPDTFVSRQPYRREDYVPSAQERYYEARLEAQEARHNKVLEQLAEANRNIAELTFRLDATSDKFRPLPLRVEHDRPKRLDTRPSGLDPGPVNSGGESLLPPKP